MKKKNLNIFDVIAKKNPPASTFDFSHHHNTTFKMGELVPTMALECLPGDEWNLSTANLLRTTPLVAPVMHKVQVRTEYFFVPNRILWADWDKWISGEVSAEHPYATADEVRIGSLGQYLGLPAGAFGEVFRFNPFFVSAYLKIYDEYYRSQDLQNEQWQPLTAGDNSGYILPASGANPLNCGWMRDYFTSALPFTQKGPEVEIPLVNQQKIPVEVNNETNTPWGVLDRDGLPFPAGTPDPLQNSNGPTPFTNSLYSGNDPAVLDPRGRLSVAIQAFAASIRDLRLAFRLQEFLETSARAGTRYKETIMGHFGVNSRDNRLQRPEYIGGFTGHLVISEVLATAENTESNIPVGYMGGHGISVNSDGGFRYKCEEHGVLIGLTRVTPQSMYADGLHKQFTRFDRFDYAWPEFAQIGEQAILNKEVKLAHAQPNGIFGYIPRYAEYKFANSRLSGEMVGSLAFWNLARLFPTVDPALNADFIKCDPSTRIFAVTDPDEDNIIAQVIHDIKVTRMLPRFGVPTI